MTFATYLRQTKGGFKYHYSEAMDGGWRNIKFYKCHRKLIWESIEYVKMAAYDYYSDKYPDKLIKVYYSPIDSEWCSIIIKVF
jgi:hypothetical protein